MASEIILPGAVVQDATAPVFTPLSVEEAMADLPGLRHVVLADRLTAGQNPLNSYDLASGAPVYATLTRSPAIVADGGSEWNNRAVMDGTGVTNLNLGLFDWEKTPSFTAILVAEKPASQHYLFRSNDTKLECLIDSGGVLRFRADGSSGASQVTYSIGTSAAGPTTYVLSFDGTNKSAAIYVNGALVNSATFAADTAVSGNLWLFSGGATVPLLGEFGAFLWFDAPYHTKVYSPFRAQALAALESWYDL